MADSVLGVAVRKQGSCLGGFDLFAWPLRARPEPVRGAGEHRVVGFGPGAAGALGGLYGHTLRIGPPLAPSAGEVRQGLEILTTEIARMGREGSRF